MLLSNLLSVKTLGMDDAATIINTADISHVMNNVADAITKVDDYRAYLGAVGNRLADTTVNLMNQ